MGLGSFVDINIFVYEIFFHLFSLYFPFLLNLLNQNLPNVETPKRKLGSFVQRYSSKFRPQDSTKSNAYAQGCIYQKVYF